MDKIPVTLAIAEKIKEVRKQNGVKAKDVAALLKKSGAYITKLEKGNIKQIDKKDLIKIIDFITQGLMNYKAFMTSIAEASSSSDLAEQTMLLNFDTVERKIPIPDELKMYLCQKTLELGLDVHTLTEYINQNEDLLDEDYSLISFSSETPRNIWIRVPNKMGNNIEYRHMIIMDIEEELIEKIFSGRIKRINYITLLAIMYHLLKRENTENGGLLDDTQKIRKEAEEVLFKHKFYSHEVMQKHVEAATSESEYESLLSSFDLDNRKLVAELLNGIIFSSSKDVVYTNEKLTGIVENMKANIGFSLSFMSISLITLSDTSQEIKKAFIKEVSDLVQEYAITGNPENNIEKY